MRRIAFLAGLLLLAAACRHSDDHQISNISTTCHLHDHVMQYTVAFTLPRGLDMGDDWQKPELIDTSGKHHRYVTSFFTRGDSPSTFTATFEDMPLGSEPEAILAGRYRIDIRHGRIDGPPQLRQ